MKKSNFKSKLVKLVESDHDFLDCLKEETGMSGNEAIRRGLRLLKAKLRENQGCNY